MARLALGLGVLSLLLAAFVGLVIWSGAAALGEMLRAEQSFRQLETARNLEAAFGRYLLAEVGRRLAGDGSDGETEEAAALREALLGYRRMIGSEIVTSGSDAERVAERGELVRSSALGELFEAIETEAVLERRSGTDPAEDARVFLNQIAGDRDRAFRAILYEIVQDERGEIAEASVALRAIRARAVALGAGIGAAFLAAALFFGLSFRSGVQRPIRELAEAADAFGQGDVAARAPRDMPGEFSALSWPPRTRS